MYQSPKVGLGEAAQVLRTNPIEIIHDAHSAARLPYEAICRPRSSA
jgi:hypothetical protein